MSDSPVPKAPPRKIITAILARYIKPEVFERFKGPDWAREISTWHGLWKTYPELHFWQHHELPFGAQSLNSMLWFRTPEGAEQLASDWLLFYFDFPVTPEPEPGAVPTDSSPVLDVDTASPSDYRYAGPPPVRPRTVAEFLRS